MTPVWTWACRENLVPSMTRHLEGDPLSREGCKVVQALKWDSVSPGSYLGNMGHVGEAVGQLLVGMDGIHSSWLGKAALRGLGRRSRW